jgi:hypothetical protein
MTIQDVTNNVEYTGDGLTTDFAFNFRVDAVSWVVVSYTQQLNAISLNIDQDTNPGGTVQYAVAPPSGQIITIQRNTPITQEKDYVRYGPFDAEAHETSLDKLTAIIQDLKEELSGQILDIRTSEFAWNFLDFQGDRTLEFTDAYKMLRSMDDGGTQTVTIPPNADVPFELGTQISFKQNGTSTLQFTPGVGVILENPFTFAEVALQKGTVTIIQDEPNKWFIAGNINPSAV